jgi:hypothetical protein
MAKCAEIPRKLTPDTPPFLHQYNVLTPVLPKGVELAPLNNLNLP